MTKPQQPIHKVHYQNYIAFAISQHLLCALSSVLLFNVHCWCTCISAKKDPNWEISVIMHDYDTVIIYDTSTRSWTTVKNQVHAGTMDITIGPQEQLNWEVNLQTVQVCNKEKCSSEQEAEKKIIFKRMNTDTRRSTSAESQLSYVWRAARWQRSVLTRATTTKWFKL